MKKIISMITAVVMCLAIFAGCSGASVDLNKVMTDINSQFNLELRELTDVEDLKTYYSIESEDVKQFAAEINADNNSAVEIVLVEAVDAEAADRISQALTTRYNSIYSQYASYSADKLSIVENSKVTQDSNYVTMIVAENSADMLDVFYGYIK